MRKLVRELLNLLIFVCALIAMWQGNMLGAICALLMYGIFEIGDQLHDIKERL